MKRMIFFFLLVVPFFANSGGLTIGITQEWAAFNPITMNLASNSAMSSLVVRSLTVRKANGDVVPDLVEKVPNLLDGSAKIVGNGQDKMLKVTWKIKSDARWSDGHDVTCEDLKFGWEVGSAQTVTVSQRSIYSNIKSVSWDSADSKTCNVEYRSVDWNFDRDVPAILPAHLEKAIFEKYKSQSLGYEQNSLYQKNPILAGLYNGPYLIKEFKIGSHVIFEPNKFFYSNQPNIKVVILKYITDSGTLRANLKTGSINSISAVGFPPDLALNMSKDLDAESEKLSRVEFFDSPIFQGVFFNLESDLLKEPSIRIALSRAINKREITKAFFDSKILPAETFLSPMAKEFHEPPNLYSPKEAIQLLKSTGWKMGEDGFFVKEGKKLSLIVRTSAGIKVLEMIETFICKEFAKIGAQCIVKNQPPRVFLGDTVPRGDFDLAIFGQTIAPDSSLRGIFHSQEIPNEKNSFAGGNISRIKDSNLDRLLVQFDGEWNQIKRSKLLAQIEKIILDKYIFIPLYHRREAFVVPASFKNLQVDSSGTGYLFPENWVM